MARGGRGAAGRSHGRSARPGLLTRTLAQGVFRFGVRGVVQMPPATPPLFSVCDLPLPNSDYAGTVDGGQWVVGG